MSDLLRIETADGMVRVNRASAEREAAIIIADRGDLGQTAIERQASALKCAWAALHRGDRRLFSDFEDFARHVDVRAARNWLLDLESGKR